ncbi:trk system potassium uptake protein TrkH [Hydrogenispora ethanolica]|uniref:Trk system potassium uptake protein TrkH n=1 Tax=Hydrogenispora ethanolica TaxID=1082276 RepID=A0A4V2QFE6_HYDET|nr:TrkH family potassium uptake protein [Hydrogenispora ethanolica]TCL71567.1 trk system potassium uptake protein TrkH [Hydrogenispora ethanolica]
MIIKPAADDLRLISRFTGKIIIGIGALMLLPLLTAGCFAEWSVAVDFTISIGMAMAIGQAMISIGTTTKKPTWIHGMVTAAFSWLVAMAVGAIPYALSGNYLSFLDAMFDVMSGFTTTGLTLIQDLDHLANGLNMWRHVITFVGGQGMIVLALTFLVKDVSGGYKLYVGEAKDERLLPSVIHTAKMIWKISLIYLAIGTFALWAVGLLIGLSPLSSFFHGLWIYMSAWSTGGFAPMTQNILYYHSFWYELVTIVIFVIGSFNFALHYGVWTGNRKEIYRNIETVSFFTTLTIFTVVGCYGLAKLHVYPEAVNLFRKGFYQIVSGHTTTGFMTIYARQFIREWGDLALLAIISVMLLGGSACSTAGGFKGLRIGIIFKAILHEMRRLLSPESAVFVQRFHYLKEQILEEKQVRSAALIVIMYMATFLIGTLVGSLSGYPLLEAAFESASVTGNVGLSIGVTSAAMPAFLKLTYIAIMWVGRLEFMSVLALFGFIMAGLKWKWK